jgi:hypothetical protein
VRGDQARHNPAAAEEWRVMLAVTTLSNQRRPGVGRQPTSAARRPWLPQHARLCPVLEAGSALGCLVYPPLEDNESYQVRYLPDNTFRFSFYVNDPNGAPDLVFATVTTPSAGGGLLADDLVYRDTAYGMSDDSIRVIKDALIVNLDTPPGAVGLRGAYDFRTPEGWDAVYTTVLNQVAPPHLAALTVRVQTDWYAHNTEFRYILQPGQIVSAAGATPVGQVFFVAREEVTLRQGSEAEVADFRAAQQRYWEGKAADQLIAAYGIKFSPHYRKSSRVNR